MSKLTLGILAISTVAFVGCTNTTRTYYATDYTNPTYATYKVKYQRVNYQPYTYQPYLWNYTTYYPTYGYSGWTGWAAWDGWSNRHYWYGHRGWDGRHVYWVNGHRYYR